MESAEDVLEKMVYTLTNPVTAGLVGNSSSWPGVSSSPNQIGENGKTVPRPEGFFRKSGPVPENAGLTVVLPPAFNDMLPDQFRQLLIEKIKTKEKQTQELFQAQGRKFLGVKGVLRQSAFDKPKKRALRRRLSPRLAGKDKQLRADLIAKLKKFQAAYEKARDAFCNGFRDTVFPPGTYKIRVQFAVACENPP